MPWEATIAGITRLEDTRPGLLDPELVYFDRLRVKKGAGGGAVGTGADFSLPRMELSMLGRRLLGQGGVLDSESLTTKHVSSYRFPDRN